MEPKYQQGNILSIEIGLQGLKCIALKVFGI